MRDLIPLFALLACVAIPIVAMLLRHQQRMAAIFIRQSQQPATLPQSAYEMQELKDMVAQQTLALDQLRQEVRALRAEEPRLSARS